jgi:hypothetical protein
MKDEGDYSSGEQCSCPIPVAGPWPADKRGSHHWRTCPLFGDNQWWTYRPDPGTDTQWADDIDWLMDVIKGLEGFAGVHGYKASPEAIARGEAIRQRAHRPDLGTDWRGIAERLRAALEANCWRSETRCVRRWAN